MESKKYRQLVSVTTKKRESVTDTEDKSVVTGAGGRQDVGEDFLKRGYYRVMSSHMHISNA